VTGLARKCATTKHTNTNKCGLSVILIILEVIAISMLAKLALPYILALDHDKNPPTRQDRRRCRLLPHFLPGPSSEVLQDAATSVGDEADRLCVEAVHEDY